MITVLAALGIDANWVMWILALSGLVVGFLNVSSEETQSFTLAAIALILSATAVQGLPMIGGLLTRVTNLVVFIAPAVLVVAVKGLLATARQP